MGIKLPKSDTSHQGNDLHLVGTKFYLYVLLTKLHEKICFDLVDQNSPRLVYSKKCDVCKKLTTRQFGFSSILSRYDVKRDNYIDLQELKLMMEKLGAPQTHLGLKNMIKEVDEDLDNKLSFREVSAA